MNNDALFTESTLAFEPRTGKLVWYYQHNRNDQYDLDWVFDRVVGTLEVNGQPRRVVITGGKSGIFDAIDAATGRYIKSVDMGIQDYIDRIDPVTGDKHVKAGMRSRAATRARCSCARTAAAGATGARPRTSRRRRPLFVNARDVCTDLTPIDHRRPAHHRRQRGLRRAAATATAIRRAAGDRHAHRRGSLWETRHRQTPDMGVLTTAGGLVFTGWMDRQFVAYDQEDGRELWRTGVTGVPNASAITYCGRRQAVRRDGHRRGQSAVVRHSRRDPRNPAAERQQLGGLRVRAAGLMILPVSEAHGEVAAQLAEWRGG